MKLKIKIKETTEEVKAITLSTQFIIRVAEGEPDKLQDEAQKILKERGYDFGSSRYHADNAFATFKTVNIRDATRDECRAWHYHAMEPDCIPPRLQQYLEREFVLELI